MKYILNFENIKYYSMTKRCLKIISIRNTPHYGMLNKSNAEPTPKR